MSQYKLIALDMDGTLLNSQLQISVETRKAIESAKETGIHVVLASGRNMHGMRPYIEQLGLRGPVVSVNGSEVWRDPDTLHSRVLMPPGTIEELYELAIRYETEFWAYGLHDVYHPSTWHKVPSDEQWIKFGFQTDSLEIVSKLRSVIEQWGTLEITNSDFFNLELNPLGISKRSGLEQVCEMVGCNMKDIVAVGDSLNDLEMIRAAGLGIAMGNAQETLKQAADYITLTNDEDGVAHVIKRYLL